ncbi:MAG: hypothetical protein KJ906_03915 [Nanoarchaeota archaeon]|nr:hypothetical protein [Nanoarchaeota archaeon]
MFERYDKSENLIEQTDKLIVQSNKIIKYNQYQKIMELYKNNDLLENSKFSIRRNFITPYNEETTDQTFNDIISKLEGENLYQKKEDGTIVNLGPILDHVSGNQKMHESDKRFADDISYWLNKEKALIMDPFGVGGGIRGITIEDKKTFKESHPVLTKAIGIGIPLALVGAGAAMLLSDNVHAEDYQGLHTYDGHIVNDYVNQRNLTNLSDDCYTITLDPKEIQIDNRYVPVVSPDITIPFYAVNHNLTALDKEFNSGDYVRIRFSDTNILNSFSGEYIQHVQEPPQIDIGWILFGGFAASAALLATFNLTV